MENGKWKMGSDAMWVITEVNEEWKMENEFIPWKMGSDAMWVITEVLADCHFGQTSEVLKTSEV
jgi:hypothetical protein